MGVYKHLNNCDVNLAQAKDLSLRRQGSLAQAKSFAQARGLRLGEHSKLKGATYCHARLGESFPFGREIACLGEHSRSHLLSRMQNQKSIHK